MKLLQLGLAAVKRQHGLLWSLPALLIMATVLLYPLLYSIALSFRDVVLVAPTPGWPFVGLRNYVHLFRDEPYLLQVGASTLAFVLSGVVGAFLVGLGLALLVNRLTRGVVFFRTIFLLPYVMPTVAISLLWMWMFNRSYGIVNYLLLEVGLIDSFKSWFTDNTLAMLPLIALYVWKDSPFQMLMLLAGLKNIPPELYDAAKVDGANAWQSFRFVTLPQLRYVIQVLLLLSVMYALQLFIPIWLLTRGGPGFNTTTLVIYVYRIAFNRYDFGLAAAVGTMWLIVLAIITGAVLKLSPDTD